MEPDALHALAVKFYQSGDYEKAHHLASLLRQLDPMSARSYKILGNANQAWGKYSWAIGAYQRAFMFDCKDTQTPFYLAQCYIHLEEWGKAHQWLKVAQSLDKDNPKVAELLQVLQQKFC